jgi:hypothetical protein
LKVQIRKNAIDFLENNYGIKPRDYNLDFFIDNYFNNCIKQLINLNTSLFELLLNINYENLTVSFNYFNENKDYNNYIEKKIINNYIIDYYHYYNNYNDYSKINYNKYNLLTNYYDNIINNPIYKILKNKLEFDYNYNYNYEFNYYKNIIDYWFNNPSPSMHIYNINNIIYIYHNDNQLISVIEHIPFNTVIYDYNKYSYNNYPYRYKNMCYIDSSINKGVCVDTNDIHNCYNELYDEYEKNKLNRYSNLTESYTQIYTIYYNEYIEIYNEYEYIKQLINLEGIPIIPPIKF